VTVTDALERKLYIIPVLRSAIQALKLEHGKEFYVPSMSAHCRAKGMLLAGQVGSYYRDLQDARMVSALALVHQASQPNLPDLGLGIRSG
jgi:glutamate synthase (ferredoxin)